jgi:hypothetical protein
MTGPAFLLGGARREASIETAIGPLAVRGNAPGAGQGWICLRPESFVAASGGDAPNARESRIGQSEFIAGRWRAHFAIGSERFWTWCEKEPPRGAVWFKISAGAWIEG